MYGPRQKVQPIAVGSLLNLGYGYDPAGNALTMNETGEGWSRGFSYDWADRLTAAQEPMSGTPSKLWSYGYNALGNMTFNSDWSGAGMDGSYVYGAQGGTGPAGPHAVTKIGGTSSTYTLTYDANGSTTSETTGLGYSYNFDGKIAAVSDTGAPLNPNAAFTYDANGDRVRKTWTNAQGRLQDLRYWAGFEELRDGATLKQDRYVMLGSSRVALLPSSGMATIYYLHPDIQGTVSLVTNQSGTVVERERFAPYGGPWAQTGSTPDLRYGYTGQEHDTESGQIHLGVRELHFTIGRFLKPDGLVPDPMNPQTLNRYSYALNNPIRYLDPSGFYSIDCVSGSNCDSQKEKFEAARQEDLKSSDARVRAAAEAYGEPDEKTCGVNNGVHVTLGVEGMTNNGKTFAKVQGVATDGGASYRGEAQVNFGSDLSGPAGKAAIAHEGVHVGQVQAYGATYNDPNGPDEAKNLTQYDREFAAYQVTAAVLRSSNAHATYGGAYKLSSTQTKSEEGKVINALLADPKGEYAVTPQVPGRRIVPEK